MAIVYIVEDDATLRDELAHLLELNGYETRACDDFETAAHDIVDVNPDCVILDLGLPGADGQSICRDVRRQSDVPIIVLTAKNDEFTEVMSLNLGAHDFVAKPYRPAVLRAHRIARQTSCDGVGRGQHHHARGDHPRSERVRSALSGQVCRADA